MKIPTFSSLTGEALLRPRKISLLACTAALFALGVPGCGGDGAESADGDTTEAGVPTDGEGTDQGTDAMTDGTETTEGTDVETEVVETETTDETAATDETETDGDAAVDQSDCGGEGQPCCEGSVCGDGFLCVQSEPSAGDAGVGEFDGGNFAPQGLASDAGADAGAVEDATDAGVGAAADASVEEEHPGMCEPCGGEGEQCCAEETCAEGYLCEQSGVGPNASFACEVDPDAPVMGDDGGTDQEPEGDGGTDQEPEPECGGDGEICCANDSGGSCDDGLECTPGPEPGLSDSVCEVAIVEECGGQNEPCCDVGNACAGELVCSDGADPVCEVAVCGTEGEACCADGAECEAGLECTGFGANATCEDDGCGSQGENCCSSDADGCDEGLECEDPAGQGLANSECLDPEAVAECGGEGQDCCDTGDECETGLECTGFGANASCEDDGCGSVGETCCADGQDGSCDEGLECDNPNILPGLADSECLEP